ncbi:MAG: EVE domain-containing protein [Gemmatimonadaceae bacterium]
MPTKPHRYWINTVSRDHVSLGVAGSFTQAGHGKNSGLKRLANGDYLVFYSPRTALKGGDPLQSFTAMGRITDDEPYQAEMTATFHPWRRKVNFISAHEAPIPPLLERLDFIIDKKRWGYPFRRGLFSIERPDFVRIAEAMGIAAKAIK